MLFATLVKYGRYYWTEEDIYLDWPSEFEYSFPESYDACRWLSGQYIDSGLTFLLKHVYFSAMNNHSILIIAGFQGIHEPFYNVWETETENFGGPPLQHQEHDNRSETFQDVRNYLQGPFPGIVYHVSGVRGWEYWSYLQGPFPGIVYYVSGVWGWEYWLC